MYDKCYFCLDQLPKLKKESTASFFVNFGRSRGTKEPTYITVLCIFTTPHFLLSSESALQICSATYTFLKALGTLSAITIKVTTNVQERGFQNNGRKSWNEE